jgi:hypothetical protein
MKKLILLAITLCAAIPITYAHYNGPESHEIYAHHHDVVTVPESTDHHVYTGKVPESTDHHVYTGKNEYPAGTRTEGVQKLLNSDYARLSGSDSSKQPTTEYAIDKMVRITTNNDMTGELHTDYGDIKIRFKGDTQPANHGDMVVLKAYKGSKQAFIYDIRTDRMISIEADCKIFFEQPK